ncbi:MAG: hypothetical protein J1E05_05900, partial [Eubacterium sp.]|nr:hypothetical protein [Eubacterium sp.]
LNCFLWTLSFATQKRVSPSPAGVNLFNKIISWPAVQTAKVFSCRVRQIPVCHTRKPHSGCFFDV